MRERALMMSVDHGSLKDNPHFLFRMLAMPRFIHQDEALPRQAQDAEERSSRDRRRDVVDLSWKCGALRTLK